MYVYIYVYIHNTHTYIHTYIHRSGGSAETTTEAPSTPWDAGRKTTFRFDTQLLLDAFQCIPMRFKTPFNVRALL